MHAERLRAGRLPDHVVLEKAHPVPVEQPRRETTGPLRQRLRGDSQVGLPAVADLPGPVLRIAARDPVDLIRPDACLVAAGEERLEALAQLPDRLVVDEALRYDDEAVALESVELFRCPVHRHPRGRRLSWS